MAEDKYEGICRFCYRTFAGSAMGRHLTTCKAKKAHDEQQTAKAKKLQTIYHLKIWGDRQYWLHIEMGARQTLSSLDSFLRDIWLECCGHLSEFVINGVSYTDTRLFEDDPFGFAEESRSFRIVLAKVLGVKDTFEYTYDFGSSTYLRGQVFASRQGKIGSEAVILARNNAPQFVCTNCGATATAVCCECGNIYCAACLPKHECGDEMALPIVNSPRVGVCAYTGDGGAFDWAPPDSSSAPLPPAP